ncbi:MAG: septum formation protein Maf [Candidatus Ruminococcus intestinipullorum]|nr:septum formation protein Maf [Candidatus Ruminococcus intestinipullorum]
MKKIILGSASPRRKELLEQMGMEFEIFISHKAEEYTSVKPEDIAAELALRKAENVASEIEAKNTIVIGADTIVVQDGKVLGKPKDRANAFEMLHSLQGKAHQVYTGIAVLNYDESGQVNVHNDVVKTEVYVHAMSEEEIKNYIATGECDDKAGGYGIQGKFAVFIEKIEGDYYNVVGLPISHLYQILKTKIC